MKIDLQTKKEDYRIGIGDILAFSNGIAEDYYMVVRDCQSPYEYRLLGLSCGLLYDEYRTTEEILPMLKLTTKNNYTFDRIIKSNKLELRQIPEEE